MSFRPIHFASTLAAPLCFALVTFATDDARAESAPSRSVAPKTASPVSAWPRRFPPPRVKPAVYARARVAAQPKAPAAQPAVAPANAPTPVVVTVEVRELRTGAPSRVERFTITLAEAGSSRIETRAGDTEYRIAVHREGSGAKAPLAFDVRKLERVSRAPANEAQVRASVRMSPGSSAVIASIERADGSRTEVLAQLQ